MENSSKYKLSLLFLLNQGSTTLHAKCSKYDKNTFSKREECLNKYGNWYRGRSLGTGLNQKVPSSRLFKDNNFIISATKK